MVLMRILRIHIVWTLILLCGCGTKFGGHVGYDNPQGIVCADLKEMPQDLRPYAARAGGRKVLLTRSEQDREAQKTLARFFRPWQQKGASRSVKDALWGYYAMRPANAYTAGGSPFSFEAWEELKINCSAENYPSLSLPAITIRNSSLRAMPTLQPFYRNPRSPGEGYPFDYFQHTALWVGSPMTLTHKSRDGEWYIAETNIASGWIRASDIAVVDDGFIQKWQQSPFLAITKDSVFLHDGSTLAEMPGKRHERVVAHIGTLLPMAKGKGSNVVLYPTRLPNGMAGAASKKLSSDEFALYPLQVSPEAIARLGNEMMNQPYGWGGISERRDCSALTRDLFLPFGVWLPRNSAQQGIWGTPILLSGVSLDDKERRIISSAVPFFSLIWLKGHIGLYIGEYKGHPAMYHSMWGLRVLENQKGEMREGRAVVGKTAITSLRPGAELHNICTPGSLLDRIERISILPEISQKLPLARPVKKVAPRTIVHAKKRR